MLVCNVNDEALRHLPISLQILDLKYCTRISNVDIKYLDQMSLQILKLSYCSLITDEAIEYIQKMPLKILELTGCKQITEAKLVDIRKTLSRDESETQIKE